MQVKVTAMKIILVEYAPILGIIYPPSPILKGEEPALEGLERRLLLAAARPH